VVSLDRQCLNQASDSPKKARNMVSGQGIIDNGGTSQHFRGAMSMMIKTETASPEEGDLIQMLREAGLRPTRQRILIASLLLDGRHRHVSADSLAREVAAAGQHMAGGTVYNTLNQFTDAGLLRRVTVSNDHAVFDTNTSHHHHFYDAAHDQLVDIPAEEVLLATLPDAPDGHDISSVDIIINIAPKASD